MVMVGSSCRGTSVASLQAAAAAVVVHSIWALGSSNAPILIFISLLVTSRGDLWVLFRIMRTPGAEAPGMLVAITSSAGGGRLV
jgi:hypothetical protein